MSHLGLGSLTAPAPPCRGCLPPGLGGLALGPRFARLVQALPPVPEALNFDDKLPESLAIIGLLLATAATNIIFFCNRRRGSSCADDQCTGLAQAREDAASPPQPANERATERVDTTALTGLRGLAALHVALGHYSGTFAGEDLLGGASMSFFYLLSGFVMTLGYAKPAKATGGATAERFDTKRFLRNRFARLYPSYFLTNVIAVVIFVGHSVLQPSQPQMLPKEQLISSAVMAVFGVNMWLYPLDAWLVDPKVTVGLPPNLVAWTVQTMAIFYLFFPALLPWLRNVRNRRGTIVGLYWLQLITFTAALLAGLLLINNGQWGYWVARSWPFGRLSVFAMGCLMAFERAQGDGRGRSMCLGLWCGAGGSVPSDRAWGRRATFASVMYLVVLVLGIFGMRLCAGGKAWTWTDVTPQQINCIALVRGMVEAVVPLLFVDLIGALTRCGNQGLAAKLCRSAVMQRMGEISMTFYMSHLLVVDAVTIFTPNESMMGVLPTWQGPICFVGALLVGWLLERFFEAPLRRCLRG